MSRAPEDQRDRISAADPQLNVALEASAGTGKTRVLVDRYVRLIQEGADPRHILAITFTRKAAGEMKSRIIEELRNTSQLWSYVRDRLFDIHIVTIDAFCLGLLKEFPLEAGIDPDMDLLDEVDAERLARDAVDDVLAATSSSSSPNLAFLVSAFGEATLRRGMRDFLSSRLVKRDAISKFVRRGIPHDLGLDSSLERAARGLAEILGGVDGVSELTSSGLSSGDPRFNSIAFALARSIDPDRVSNQDIEHVAEYFLTREGAPRQKLATFKKRDFATPTDYEHHRDLVLARAPGVGDVYRRWSTDRDRYAVREIWRLYQKVLNRFSQLKEAHRGLDFTDILIRAVDLLEKRGEFSQSRFRLESRYHHILIDEFQDTNKFQWRLITALIDSWGEGAGLVQDAILREQAFGHGKGLLTEPTVFIVGDRKQSIYGWRDARVEIMEDAAQHLERLIPGRGKRLRLRQSFRARGSLLAFLNDVFAEMPQIRDELEWTFRYRADDHFPIHEARDNDPRVGLAVTQDLGQAAATVADEVARLLVEEDYHPRDIAILFRSRTHYREYEKALNERGVPTYVYRGLGFFDSPEVLDIQALVRFLAEPSSELRAAELARSRFIGFTDTGLALLSSLRPLRAREEPLASLLRGHYREKDFPPTISKEDEAAACRAITWVPSWIRKVGDIPPSDLIQLVLAETDYAAYFSEPESGDQGWENLKKILELVRRAQNRGYLTFARLAEYLENAAGGDESLAVLEAVDAVSLMTIHAAKGLEFDAVFVVNLDQKTRSDTSLPRIIESSSEAVDVHALARPDFSGPQRALEEEKRLLYVALTRARRDLVLSAAKLEHMETQTTLFHLLPESLRRVMQSALTTQESDLSWDPRGNRHLLRVLREQPEPRRYQSRESSTRRHLALDAIPNDSLPRISVSALVREQTGEEISPWALNPIDLAVGGAVHRMFEYDVQLTDALVDVAEAVLPDLSGHRPSEKARAAKKAADLYTRLRQQPELQDLLTKGRVLREVPFALHGKERIVYGAIDSLILAAGQAVVIDYKTGKSRPEHRLQMELYLEAVRALFPGHQALGLVFYPQGTPLKVRPPADNAGQTSQLQLW